MCRWPTAISRVISCRVMPGTAAKFLKYESANYSHATCCLPFHRRRHASAVVSDKPTCNPTHCLPDGPSVGPILDRWSVSSGKHWTRPVQFLVDYDFSTQSTKSVTPLVHLELLNSGDDMPGPSIWNFTYNCGRIVGHYCRYALSIIYLETMCVYFLTTSISLVFDLSAVCDKRKVDRELSVTTCSCASACWTGSVSSWHITSHSEPCDWWTVIASEQHGHILYSE